MYIEVEKTNKWDFEAEGLKLLMLLQLEYKRWKNVVF